MVIWPELKELGPAIHTARLAAIFAGTLSAFNALSLGDGFNLITVSCCILFGIAAWRIWDVQYPWAVLALILGIVQTVIFVRKDPFSLTTIFMPVAVLLFIHGVRATSMIRNLVIRDFEATHPKEVR
ncbi:MAG TPA: hypothetical protein VGK36_25615 [Candidatus Angelobacter sp.]|jgi:hypothetical protein